MRPWSDFYDLVLPDVPGAVTAAVDIALRQAAITFFAETGVWRVWLESECTLVCQSTYHYNVPPSTQVHSLLAAKINCLPAQILRPDQCADGVLDLNRKQYKIIPTPMSSGLCVSLEVELKPSQLAAGIPEEYYDQFRSDIAHGALARLMISPKKPYTDLAIASIHEGKFKAACDMQSYKQFKGHGSSIARIKAGFF